MSVPGTYAAAAIEATVPEAKGREIALTCAMEAVRNLRAHNSAYPKEHAHLEDNFPEMPFEEPKPEEPVVQRLTQAYLMAFNRRGLIGL